MYIYVSCVTCVEATNAMALKLAVSIVPLVPESDVADSLHARMRFNLGDSGTPRRGLEGTVCRKTRV